MNVQAWKENGLDSISEEEWAEADREQEVAEAAHLAEIKAAIDEEEGYVTNDGQDEAE